ncbi:hypothetical protein T265_01876 [Opisthorchis viverrini]|uniref:Uncharacterized protein n=1 Tax=Opisthorchis viverrini TaxID=6198 RepID=A0A074ZXX2_OPIVI|nr:hypothetical protein T265_01876 [Opisthorchis viverrini]KER31941.1 hypothetical protein T265_01876 [Opisthorchis viverrini]
MELEKSAEEIPESIEKLSADSAGQAHSEQDLGHIHEEAFTQEDSEHVKETVDYFHGEGTELNGQSQSEEFIRSETAYVQADEVPIRYDATENVQACAPTVVFETVENSFAEKGEDHIHLEDAQRGEEILGSSKEEAADFGLITRETATGQDFEPVSENIFPHVQAESSDEHDKVIGEDQNEPSDIVEGQYLEGVKHFEKQQQEDEILQGESVNGEEFVEKFPAEHKEHVDPSQEISGVQDSENSLERGDYDHLPHTEDHIEELPTEGAKLENMSQVLDVQYFQQPVENETHDRLLQEFTEHTEEPLEQPFAKDAEPEGISQEISVQKPPEKETKDHLLPDHNEHIEGSAEHIPDKDAEPENMLQEAIDAEHFQGSFEHEVLDHDEHTEGSVEDVTAKYAEIEDVSQEVLADEHFQQPLEDETRDRLLQELAERSEVPVEQLSAKDSEPEYTPQETIDAEHFQGSLEHDVQDHGLHDHDEHTEESVEHVPTKDAELEEMPQEVLDAEHFQGSLEHDVRDHGLHDHDKHTGESIEHVPAKDEEVEDISQEVLDAEHFQESPEHETQDRLLQEFTEHNEESVGQLSARNAELEEIPQEVIDSEDFQQPSEIKTDHLLPEYTEQSAEEFPADFAGFSDVSQVSPDTQHSGQTPQGFGNDEETLDDSKRIDVFQETLEIQHLEQPPEYDDGALMQLQDTEHVEKFSSGSFNQDVQQADTTPELLDIQYSEIPGQHTPAGDVLHSDVERDIVEDDYIPRETSANQLSEQVLEQETKDTPKFEDINEEIPDEATDYGNDFIKIANSPQLELEGERQVQQSEGHFESDSMEDSAHQESQKELKPEYNEHVSEDAGKPFLESTDYSDEPNLVKREHVFEQDDANLDAESVPPQVGESHSDQTGNNAHENIQSTEENTNDLHPDQAGWAESHESGSAEPMPDNGSINGLDVGYLQLEKNVPETVESNGDFDHSMKLLNTGLIDQQDFDSDISRSPKPTAACDSPHDEDQHPNGLPVSGAENLI